MFKSITIVLTSCVDSAMNVGYDSLQIQKQSVRSIQEWGVSCTCTTDDTERLRTAITAARNDAFILQVDCPINIKIGMDIAKPIFIDNGTTINFTKQGLLTVDNVFIPSFVISNSHDIHLTGWNVKYAGGLPISEYTGGYYENGKWISVGADIQSPPAQYFLAITLTNWLSKERGIVFAKNINSFSNGIWDEAAIFHIKGDSYGLSFESMNISTNYISHANKYIPMVFSLSPDYANNQDVISEKPANPPIMKPYVNVPHDVVFNDIILNGIYFGWHGSTQSAKFSNIMSYNYSTLQDEFGGNVGGLNHHFPPPHLFYFISDARFASNLYNSDIKMSNISDYGIKIGLPEYTNLDPRGGPENSIKLQANNSLIDGYYSDRPDGFLDLLPSNNLEIYNVLATYNSSLADYNFPIIRFFDINLPYKNIKFQNIELNDLAINTFTSPIFGSRDSNNDGIQFYNTKIKVGSWLNEEAKPFNPTELLDKHGYLNQSYFGGTNHKFDVQTIFSDNYHKINAYGVSVYKNEDMDPNTLQNIPLSSFGRLDYKVENTTSKDMILTIPQAKYLPRGVVYYMVKDDRFPNLCIKNIDSSLIRVLAHTSCDLVFQYNPILEIPYESGIINYQMSYITADEILDLPILKIPYSRRISRTDNEIDFAKETCGIYDKF